MYSKKRRSELKVPLSILSVALGTLGLLQTAGDVRAQVPANCVNGGMASIIGVSPTLAHVGDTITISALGVSLGGLSCDITNGQSFVMYPDGNATVRSE